MSSISIREHIAIFREKLLPYSETFIINQAASLERYTPEFVSFERLPTTPDLPIGANVLLEQPGMRSYDVHALKLMGRVPVVWRERLKSRKFNLMHAHFGPDALWSLPLARQLGLPLVTTFHGYDLVPTQKPLGKTYYYYQWRRKMIFTQSIKILAVSNFIRSKLIEAGCPEEKIIVHYIGVDVGKFQPKVAQREPIVLYVGRLIEQKGILDLVRAMRFVLREHPKARMVVIGSGVMEAQVRAAAESLKVPCDFLGAQSSEQVRIWMSRAALLCVPARHEAFGLVYVEAQAMHLPVVAYAHSGVIEAVCDGVGGLLTPVGDVQKLAAAIDILLNDSERRERMGRAGRKYVHASFNLQKQTQTLEEVYDQVLHSSRREVL